jgi:hypothetical protein
MRSLLVAAAVLSIATPAFADFYIVQDSATRHCAVTETRPTVATTKVVGPDGTVYKTREEAATAMKTVKVCEPK